METQKPYLKSDLSIEELAREAAIPTYLVSKLLNQYLNENFYEFVNRYRVEAVKHRLSDPQYADFTILSIAFDCGFQSKSTFNESFKKVAGCTPSAFRRRALVRNPRK
jgi:AraC-like DNA-binding protein